MSEFVLWSGLGECAGNGAGAGRNRVKSICSQARGRRCRSGQRHYAYHSANVLLPGYKRKRLLSSTIFLSTRLCLCQSIHHLKTFYPPTSHTGTNTRICSNRYNTSRRLSNDPFNGMFCVLTTKYHPLPIMSILSTRTIDTCTNATSYCIVKRTKQVRVPRKGINSISRLQHVTSPHTRG